MNLRDSTEVTVGYARGAIDASFVDWPTGSLASLLMACALTALTFATGKRLLAFGPATRKRVSLIAASLLLVGALLTDLPFGTSYSSEFWSKHSLFTGVLTSILILGLGYLAIDAQFEEARDLEFKQTLQAMVSELEFEGVLAITNVSTPEARNLTSSDGRVIPKNAAQVQTDMRAHLDRVALRRDSANTWLTIMTLSHHDAALSFVAPIREVRAGLAELHLSLSRGLSLVDELLRLGQVSPSDSRLWGNISDEIDRNIMALTEHGATFAAAADFLGA